jgi:hypothetical protein
MRRDGRWSHFDSLQQPFGQSDSRLPSRHFDVQPAQHHLDGELGLDPELVAAAIPIVTSYLSSRASGSHPAELLQKALE